MRALRYIVLSDSPKQESCAIAKMTARCALYMIGVLFGGCEP